MFIFLESGVIEPHVERLALGKPYSPHLLPYEKTWHRNARKMTVEKYSEYLLERDGREIGDVFLCW